MINDKIGKLMSELQIIIAKTSRVYFDLSSLLGEIETEKAIENCKNCVHNKGIYNNFIFIHEVCEAGHCVLCNRFNKECKDFKEGKYVPTQDEIDDF